MWMLYEAMLYKCTSLCIKKVNLCTGKKYYIVLIKKVLYSTNKKENIIFIKKLNLLLLYIIYNNNLHKYMYKKFSIQYVWFRPCSHPLLSVKNIFYIFLTWLIYFNCMYYMYCFIPRSSLKQIVLHLSFFWKNLSIIDK